MRNQTNKEALTNVNSLSSQELLILRKEFRSLQSQLRISQKELFVLLEKPPKDSVPLSIFKNNLSPLEALSTHLKNQGLNYAQIGRLLNRDERTIWTTITNAYKKSEEIVIKQENYIPINALTNRKYSILESITAYLREQKNMRIKEIAEVLGRNPVTISTVYQRYKHKKTTKSLNSS